MYGNVELASGQGGGKKLAIPDSAVLDSGNRQAVLVRRGEGLFEPRTVKLGRRADGYVEVSDGLQAGEQVVVRANFLIDAESNLTAALDTFGGHAGQAKPEAAKPAPAAAGAQAHTGRGTVKSVDMKNGTVEINHGPIASLKWPAMTMEFKAKGKAMLAGVKPGQSVEFDISQRGAGEFVIERIAPAGVAEHKGH
jgi:Cu(I)/Ag(I) efflux system membrane fusion protein